MGRDGWGIEDGWQGVDGAWHPAPAATVAALRQAMGGDPDREHPPHHRPAWVVRPGAADPLQDPCHLTLEDGTDLGVVTALPADLPLGYHRLDPADAGPTTHLICSPGRCHLPEGLREWGVSVQVPSARSRRSWGIGDLTDLAGLARWARGEGAGFLALSPLHAPQPSGPPADSPYYPSSRRWRSPLLIDVDAVPGAERSAEVAHHGAAARALLARRRIDRPAVWGHQRAALERLWADRAAPRVAGRAFDRWRSERGTDLEAWATYAALAEVHGVGWSRWPHELRHPAGPAVAAAAAPLADRIAFHAWLQWLVATQLDHVAGQGLRLVHDLAVGCDPDGFDAWWWQDLLMGGARVGAPPDAFATDGQDWGLPPFRPWALRDAGYQPLVSLLRTAMAAGSGLRIDHVMGLTRLFCIPTGSSPAAGTYVRYPGRELLEVVALESHRAGALVVGEDLGTVEPGFREQLAEAGILSTRLVLFEDDPPEVWPVQAQAAITTHDLPTVTGLWTGADTTELAALDRTPPEHEVAQVQRRVRALVEQAPAEDRTAAAEPTDVRAADPEAEPKSGPGDGPDLDAGAATIALHRRLGASPAVLALATLEDLVGVAERPNVPGTTVERPNWSLALPIPIEDLPAHRLAAAVTAALRAGRAEVDD